MKNKKHIFIGKNGKAEKYVYPRTVVINKTIPERDRASHGESLSSQLMDVKPQEKVISKESECYELDSPVGVQISFESFAGVELEFERLADVRSGIEVLNVIHVNDKYVATILVPLGKFTVLEKKIAEYLTPEKDNKKGPKHAALLNAIASIRATVIENLWTDDFALFPVSEKESLWFEVWLPVRDDRVAIENDFKKLCKACNITVSDSTLEFPERTILLIKSL